MDEKEDLVMEDITVRDVADLKLAFRYISDAKVSVDLVYWMREHSDEIENVLSEIREKLEELLSDVGECIYTVGTGTDFPEDDEEE